MSMAKGWTRRTYCHPLRRVGEPLTEREKIDYAGANPASCGSWRFVKYELDKDDDFQIAACVDGIEIGTHFEDSFLKVNTVEERAALVAVIMRAWKAHEWLASHKDGVPSEADEEEEARG